MRLILLSEDHQDDRDFDNEVLNYLDPYLRDLAKDNSESDFDADDLLQTARTVILRSFLQTPAVLRAKEVGPDKRNGAIWNTAKKARLYAKNSMLLKGHEESGFESGKSLTQGYATPGYAEHSPGFLHDVRQEYSPKAVSRVANRPDEPVDDSGPPNLSKIGRLLNQVKANKYPFSPMQMDFLRAKYIDGLSSADIARKMGVSKPRITQLERAALDKLRKAAEDLGITESRTHQSFGSRLIGALYAIA